jgi:hypothetical protein
VHEVRAHCAPDSQRRLAFARGLCTALYELKLVRVPKVAVLLCAMLIGACDRAVPPAPQLTVTREGLENEAETLADSENPRCLHQGYGNGETRCEEYRVSIVELLANPAQWHEKKVMVIGFAATGFEHSAIYLHRQDLEAGITTNGLWLELPADLPSASLEKGEYVLVRGTFDAKAGGHLNGFNGTIHAVKVRPWGG